MRNKSARSLVVLGFLVAASCSDQKVVIKAANSVMDPLPEAVVTSNGSPDPMADKQWANERLGLPGVWTAQGGQSGRRVTVAILSTGVDYNHEDIRGNILVNSAESVTLKPGDTNPLDGVDNDGNGYIDDLVGYDVIDDDGLPFDQQGPGTAAAGIIGGVHNNGKGIKGINVNVSMIPVRYIGSNGQATVPNLIKALRYAATVKPDVVYLHLANIDISRGVAKAMSAEEVALREVLGRLQTASTPVIASAGNTGSDLSRSKAVIQILSEYKNSFIVTSVDEHDRRPFIANYGMELVDTSAPGEGILTTQPGNAYRLVNGTSAAAAHVGGAVALVLAKHFGQVSLAQVYKSMLSEAGSDRVPGLQFETVGGNRLNVGKLLVAIEKN